jgi:PAS domain S-box-containing protein
MFLDRSDFRILVLDDDEDDFFITNEYIKNISGYNFKVEWTWDYNVAMDAICSKKYDLFLVDYLLGAKTGLDFIKDAASRKCDEPIIILTGKGNAAIDVEAMHAGAVDYLIKGEMDTEKLARCIRHVMEKRAALRRLEANEKKFRHIFERSKDAVFIADPEFNFLEVNSATGELFEYDYGELVGKSLISLFARKKDEEILLYKLDSTGDVDDHEIEMLTMNGEIKTCILSLSKETDNRGKTFLQGIIHDITNLKKAEKATVRLEKLGMAERLVRTLAHEVRNPLNNINLSIEQLSSEMETDDYKHYIEIITRNSKRIEGLITELLGASRPEIVLQTKKLQEIIEESIAAAQDRMTLRHMRLLTNLPDDPIYIKADPEKLKIAFLNIIINAIEAMEDNKGVLNISIRTEGEHSEVAITDNGCGINEESLSRLFEPYFTAKKNGLGLGLATTLNILQLHQASVEVKSKPGEGTSFLITMNNVKEEVEAETI